MLAGFFRKNYKVIAGLLVLILIPVSFLINRKSMLEGLPSMHLAKKHSIYVDKPAPDFFEGALLGNGGLGVVVSTRPDAVVFYFGHNNVWDIRIAENHKHELGDFNYVFNKVKTVSPKLSKLTHNQWYKEYHRLASDNYSKPYPRPFPCGSVVLSFDRRKVELTGHMLDISNGVCTVKFLTTDKKRVFLKVMTDMIKDKLLMQLVDANGKPVPNLFTNIKINKDPSTPGEFPKYTTSKLLDKGVLFYRQTLPTKSREDYKSKEDHKLDKAVSITVKVNGVLKKEESINVNGGVDTMGEMEGSLTSLQTFSAVVQLNEGLNTAVPLKPADIATPTYEGFVETVRQNISIWNKYWSKSSVELNDNLLEQVWYRNLYFFNCAAKDGVNCPGLFANWSYNKIGSEWHGDYHLNYNLQQPFWATFSSNHLEKNLPYVNVIESLMPVSRNWAQEYYKLPGAFFPHSAYPGNMTINPYPIPDWGWEISETPWAVQGLWWDYIYSGDTTFLRTRAYEPMKAAVQFLTAYMQRPEAYGKQWKDKKYHIFPTVPPELHGLTPGFKYNYDCALDLTLTKFIFKAFEKATVILGVEKDETKLLADVKKILQNFPAYPTAESKENGEVYVATPGEHAEVVYNIPIALSPVFPGEEIGIDTDKTTLNKWINSYKNQQSEGGNDLVFLNMQAARLGILDLAQFKRLIGYCLLPNGTATNLVVQTKGRYSDETDFKFMAKSGIWFENFGLPAVINECLMQGYDGTIKLFPNWPKEKDASFTNLRAAGAFLVSATQKAGIVNQVKIVSEKGNELRVKIPWGASGHIASSKGRKKIESDIVIVQTLPGEVITLIP